MSASVEYNGDPEEVSRDFSRDSLDTLAAAYHATFKMCVDEDDPEDTPEGALAKAEPYIEALEEEVERLRSTIERERTAVCSIVAALRETVRSHRGMSVERGSYEWDDDGYRKEFGRALDAIDRRIDAIEREGHACDLTDCPTTQAPVDTARSIA
jgi:hypothetical protein